MSRRISYVHTQRGWTLIALLGGVCVFAVAVFALAGAKTIGASVTAVLTFVLLLFHSLTVSVGDDTVALRFGIGLVRKVIPVSQIKSYRVVKNRFWHGYGIRFTPHGTLWNVSGLGAVELLLESGKRFRVGTDEPEILAQALRSVIGEARPYTTQDEAVAAKRRRGYWVIVLSLVLVIVGGVSLLLWGESRPPAASIDAAGLHVSSAVYSVDVPFDRIVSVSLEQRLPRILMRTNGTGFGRTLRGHFRLEHLGEGRLFLEYGYAPYLFVKTKDGFVVVGYEDPERTRSLYRGLVKRR